MYVCVSAAVKSSPLSVPLCRGRVRRRPHCKTTLPELVHFLLLKCAFVKRFSVNKDIKAVWWKKSQRSAEEGSGINKILVVNCFFQ